MYKRQDQGHAGGQGRVGADGFAGVEHLRHTAAAGAFVADEHGIARVDAAVEAVSYTHLDVYKRQGQGHAAQGQVCTDLRGHNGALHAGLGDGLQAL